MARTKNYSVGGNPPFITWTFVRGDSASFKAYVADDAKQALNVADWSISMKTKRPNTPVKPVVITDDATLILTTIPAAEIDELPGYFTVSLSPEETNILQTGDIFDIQLSSNGIVWTVCQGSMIVIEDVTD
jgi:hypothetical protein